MISSSNSIVNKPQLIIDIEQIINRKSSVIKRVGKIFLWIFANAADWAFKKLKKQFSYSLAKKETITCCSFQRWSIHEKIKKLLTYCLNAQLEEKLNQAQLQAERILSSQFSIYQLSTLHIFIPYCQKLNFAFLTLLVDSEKLSDFINPVHKNIIKAESIILLTNLIQENSIPLTKFKFLRFIQENIYIFHWLNDSNFTYSDEVDVKMRESLSLLKQNYAKWQTSQACSDKALSQQMYIKQILKHKLEEAKEHLSYISKKDLLKSLDIAVSSSSLCQSIFLPIGSLEDKEIRSLLISADFKPVPRNRLLFKRQHLIKQKIRMII